MINKTYVTPYIVEMEMRFSSGSGTTLLGMIGYSTGST